MVSLWFNTIQAPFSLYQAYHLSRHYSKEGAKPEEKGISLLVDHLFLYQAFCLFSPSPFVTKTTCRILYGLAVVLPFAKMGARWVVWQLGWRGTEGGQVERELSHLLNIVRPLLMEAAKIHSIALSILNQDVRPLIFFVPPLIDQLAVKSGSFTPRTERLIKGSIDAFNNLCLFFPLSIPYYLKEFGEILFCKKQIGPYTSFLLENYLLGLDACQGRELGWNDTLTPAYFAVLQEVERLIKGEVHPDLGKYPKRFKMLENLRAAIEQLSTQELNALKEEILKGNRGSPLAKQIQTLTGYYTGTAADSIKEDGFFPHQILAEDARTIKKTEQILPVP